MKTIYLLSCIIACCLASAPPDNHQSWQTVVGGYSNNNDLAASANFQLKYAVDDQPVDNDVIHFILTGNTPGYMAFGIMKGHHMANIDIVSFEHSNGSITVTDRFSQDTSGAPVDNDNGGTNYLTFDSANSSFDSQNNQWILRWSRRLETGDTEQDIPLYCGKNYAVVATSDSPIFDLHTFFQAFVLDILTSNVGGCTPAPSGWTDWYDMHDNGNQQGDEDNKNQSSLIQLHIFLILLCFIIY